MFDENQELNRFLENPETYGVERVDRIDTHASHVFLAGERAYKLKRPVHYPFMDFSTLEKREIAARHELELNRRTAPELYLHLASVENTQGRFRIVENGTPGPDVVDWLVVMRRFRQSSLLSSIADQGALEDHHVDRLRDSIVSLHKSAASEDVDWAASMKWVVEDNIEELKTFASVFTDQSVIARASEVTTRSFTQDRDALHARAQRGHIKQCHGDLHLGNVAFIDDRAVLFDALEFNPSLSTIDTLYDSAFVLMDLMARGFSTQSFRLMNGILDRFDDEEGLALLPLYLATRAIIRAKVSAALAFREPTADAHATANHYLRVAEPCLLEGEPRLCAIGGLSGTGKSTVSQEIGPHLGARPGARWLRSDVVRKLQAGVEETETLPSSAYGPGTSVGVYQEMFKRAETALRAGHSVVLDAVFAREEERDRAHALAKRLNIRFDAFWLEAPTELRRQRVDARVGDVSDADVAVVERQRGQALGDIRWKRIDASEGVVDRVWAELNRSETG